MHSIGRIETNAKPYGIKDTYTQEGNLASIEYISHYQNRSDKCTYDNDKLKIAVLNFGSRASIIKYSLQNGEIKIFDENSNINDLLDYNPHCIVFASGPGDPRLVYSKNSMIIKKAIELNVPILGVCLGCQLIALHFGCSIKRLENSHHSSTHPIMDVCNNKVFISSHNHDYYISSDNLPIHVEKTFVSLFDNTLEGFVIKSANIYGYQFHPESRPGPNDTIFLLDDFFKLCNEKCQKIAV